jgi:hypothetical protein
MQQPASRTEDLIDGHVMAATEEQTLEEAVREAEEARAIRVARDAALTPEQRLERVHALCRQLAAIRPVDDRR